MVDGWAAERLTTTDDCAYLVYLPRRLIYQSAFSRRRIAHVFSLIHTRQLLSIGFGLSGFLNGGDGGFQCFLNRGELVGLRLTVCTCCCGATFLLGVFRIEFFPDGLLVHSLDVLYRAGAASISRRALVRAVQTNPHAFVEVVFALQFI